MNRGQLKTRVSRILGMGLGTDDGGAEEEALLEELAIEAIEDILVRTRIHVRVGEAAPAPGYREFDLTQQIMRIFEVRRNGVLLEEQPREQLAADGFAFAGLSRMVLGQASEPGDTISFRYVPKPTPMILDSHDPALQVFGRIPSEHHRAILDYMCWHAADRAGDQGSGRGERYRVLYEGQDGMGNLGSDLGRIRIAINMRSGVSRTLRRREVLAGDTEAGYWVG